MGHCSVCGSCLGCAADCSMAPWNWELPTTNRLGYIKRLVKWILSFGYETVPLSFRPDIWFTRFIR